MSKFNLDTDFCRQCGCDSGWCDGCVKKKYYQQGRAEAIDEIMGNLAETDISDRDFRFMKDVCEEIRKGTK